MKNFYLLLFTSLFFLHITSCSFDRQVKAWVFNSEFEGKALVIDGDTLPIDQEKMFTSFKLDKGKHKIESSGVLPDSVTINVDGLICSGNTNFAQVPVYYKAGQGSDFNIRLNPAVVGPILVGDSTVIFNKTRYADQATLIDAIQRILPKMSEAADAGRSFQLADQTMRELRMNDNNIIPQSWDFDFDNIPEEINIESTSANATATRTLLLSEPMLRVYALFDEEMSSETIESDAYRDIFQEYVALRFLVF